MTATCGCMVSTKLNPHNSYGILYTVEPPNKGHFGAHEVVLISEVRRNLVSFVGRSHPFLKGSFIRGSTVPSLQKNTRRTLLAVNSLKKHIAITNRLRQCIATTTLNV